MLPAWMFRGNNHISCTKKCIGPCGKNSTAKKTVESLPLEEYVVGVVASEMPADFETEALKAQAFNGSNLYGEKVNDG